MVGKRGYWKFVNFSILARSAIWVSPGLIYTEESLHAAGRRLQLHGLMKKDLFFDYYPTYNILLHGILQRLSYVTGPSGSIKKI